MLKNEFLEFKKKYEDWEDDTYELYVENKLIENIEVYSKRNRIKGEIGYSLYFWLYSRVKTDCKFLSKYSIEDFPTKTDPSVAYINYGQWADFFYFEIEVSLQKSETYYTGQYYYLYVDETTITANYNLLFTVSADLNSWKESYSYEEYWNNFKNVCEKKNFNTKLEFISKSSGRSFISVTVESLNVPVSEIIEKELVAIKEVHNEVIDKLRNSREAIFATFIFPSELKSTCEQYLLYFAQFLQDLGIKATSNLKETAGNVLFSVTPTDDVEALDKIREALAVYLNLPSSPVVFDESFASMRLNQQVDNLQHAQRMAEMEFRLAQKVIENQDKIIQQKDSVIEQQTKILEKITDKAVMINSAENKEELEEIFDGVRVGKSKFLAEQIGLHLNPATALKAVGKKLIGKDDEFTSLNLDKEDAE